MIQQRLVKAGETGDQRLRASTRSLLIATAIYTIFAIIVTWPITAHFSSGLVGEVGGVDAYQNAWNMWWVAEALWHGQQPFWTPLLFYPDGVNLFWQTLGFSQALVALPITCTLGPLAAVNFTVVTSYILGGLGTFLLARHARHNTPAALVAGAIYAFSPFHAEKVIDGNIEVAAIQWVPFFILALQRLFEQPNWKRALVSGGLLLWVSLGSWYYGLFCVLYSGCAIAIHTIGRPRQHAIRFGLWGIAPLLIWGLALAIPIVELARSGDQTLYDMRRIQAERSADLIDFFLPNPANPWWGPVVRAARDQIYPNAVIWNVALGWVGILLSAIGGVVAWRSNWRWTALLCITLILAMGPTLRIAGYRTGIPLPFALIQNLPGIRASQRPNHMVVIASLLLAVLAAYGASWLARKLPARLDWHAAIGLMLAVVLIDGYAGQLHIVRREIHPFYATIADSGGAILPLPLYVNINRSDNLTPQMTHHLPIVGGYVARPPDYPFATFTPGVRELQDGLAHRGDIVKPGWPESARQALAAYDIRYITLDLTSHKDSYFQQVRELIDDLGLGRPVVVDTSLEVYMVPRASVRQPLIALGAGWQALEQQPNTDSRWRWMGEQGEIRLYNPFDRPVITTLSITASSYQAERMLQLSIDGKASGQLRIASEGQSMRRVIFLLNQGEHILTLNAPALPDPGRIGATISIRVFEMTAEFSQPLQDLSQPAE